MRLGHVGFGVGADTGAGPTQDSRLVLPASMRKHLSRSLLAAILHLLLGSVLLSSIPAADPELDDARRHLAGLSVPPWHDAGVQGQGMTVAVLDSGFRNYRDFLGKGLPASVSVRSFRKDGD